MNVLDSYHKKFNNNALEVSIGEGKFFIDTNKTRAINPELPTLIFDTDHTFLNVTLLKQAFQEAFVQYDARLTPTLVMELYEQSKDRENFYNYKKHMHLLAQVVGETKEPDPTLVQAIEDLNIAAITKNTHEWVYDNIEALTQQYNDKSNFIFMTAGFGEYQRIKLAAILETFHIQPNFIVFVENMYKGDVVVELFNRSFLIPTMEEKGIYILDDNIDELVDIAEKNPEHKLQLLRIKQSQGKYNHKALPSTSPVIELDCTNGEAIALP